MKWKTLTPQVKIILAVCLTGIMLNIADCAAFGVLNDRYGTKMIWLLPLCVLLYVANSRMMKAGIEKAALL